MLISKIKIAAVGLVILGFSSAHSAEMNLSLSENQYESLNVNDGVACAVSSGKKNQSSLAAVAAKITTDNKCKTVVRTQQGESSFYGKGDGFHGQIGFCGGKFLANKMTLALPQGKVARPGKAPTAGQVACGTTVRLTNPKNGKVAYAVVTDTGGFAKYGRMADVSYGVASNLGFVNAGHTKLKMEICGG